MKKVFYSIIGLGLLLAHSLSAADVEYLSTGKAAGLPFSDAVRVGNMLYLSGEIGMDYSIGRLAEGGIRAEAFQVMENIRMTLEKLGSSMDRIVKCTVMIADMKEWKDFNEVYVTYFDKDHLPARSAFGANGLALGARVEVECIATIQD